MRNVWKGMIAGAFMGAAVGLAVESVEGTQKRIARSATEVGDRITDALPPAIERTKGGVEKARSTIADKAPTIVDNIKHAAG